MKSISRCLSLSPDDKDGLHLYTLLLTAQKQMPEAYAQIYRATNDYPDIRFHIDQSRRFGVERFDLFSLLLTKAAIEEEFDGCEQSIISCKEALVIWKNQFEPILLNNTQQVRGISHSRSVESLLKGEKKGQ